MCPQLLPFLTSYPRLDVCSEICCLTIPSRCTIHLPQPCRQVMQWRKPAVGAFYAVAVLSGGFSMEKLLLNTWPWWAWAMLCAIAILLAIIVNRGDTVAAGSLREERPIVDAFAKIIRENGVTVLMIASIVLISLALSISTLIRSFSVPEQPGASEESRTSSTGVLFPTTLNDFKTPSAGSRKGDYGEERGQPQA